MKQARVAVQAADDFGADVAALTLEAHPPDIVDAGGERQDADLLRDGRFTQDPVAEREPRGLPGLNQTSMT